jgi:predicted O-linked N-acetylglucosamine transferase (SPINDLY family)
MDVIKNEAKVGSLLRDEKYRDALRLYIQEFRNSGEEVNLSNIASCLYMLGKSVFAEKLANKVIDLNKDHELRSTLVLANIQLDSGNIRDALKLYRKVSRGKLARHGYLGIAMINLARGRKEAGKRILESATKKYREEAWPFLNQSLYFIKLGDFKLAWQSISQCLKKNETCIEAWIAAYECAINMNEFYTAKSIARKLVSLDNSVARFHAFLGIAAYKIGEDPDEVVKAYEEALKIDSLDISYIINSCNPCHRIAPNGKCANEMAARLKWTANNICQEISKGTRLVGNGRHPIVNPTFNIAYSPLNLKTIYENYFLALSLGFKSIIRSSLRDSKVLLDAYSANLFSNPYQSGARSSTLETAKVRIGFASQNFYGHSNTQAFAGLLKYVDRSIFEVVVIHKPFTKPDSIQFWVNSLADEVVYLGDSLGYAHATLCRLDLDILFFTDLGMDPWDFILPEMRACKIQLTGWGLPHTSGLGSIDYYLSSSLQETSSHQKEYTEKLILLDGLPCCFLAELLNYQIQQRDYFMLPPSALLIGCVQSLGKIHPDFDLIIENISKRLPDAFFVFVCSGIASQTQQFINRLEKRAPTASNRIFMLDRCYTEDFLSLCDCLDILLDTPYYGAGITSYMSAYVGTPVVCFQGTRLRDSTTAAIYKYLEIKDAPIASNMHEYVDLAVQLAKHFDLRLQIKKDTVAAASKLYDQQDYVRSFEKFCLEIIHQSETDADSTRTRMVMNEQCIEHADNCG